MFKKKYKQTKEHKRKNSETHKGVKLSKEHRKNIGKALKGKKKPLRSEKHKRNLSLAKKGKPRAGNPKNWKHTEQTKKKQSKSRRKGLKEGKIIVWNKNKKNPYIKGDKNPAKRPEVRKKLSLQKRGSKNPNWVGGTETYRGMDWFPNKKRILKNKGYKCQRCNKEGKVDVHHLVPYRISHDNSLENLLVLCRSCHQIIENKLRKKEIKISEVFESIQGEGEKCGKSVLFIRTSECNRRCSYCDTAYHWKGKWVKIEELIKKIKNSKLNYICWTGGEPLLWKYLIYKIINKTKEKQHFIETNGDFLQKKDILKFDFISCSPKDEQTAKRIRKLLNKQKMEIKIVTDLNKIGLNMLRYATTLMPLTTCNKQKDLEIHKKVWNYCIKNNFNFSPRIQVWLWGNKKGV